MIHHMHPGAKVGALIFAVLTAAFVQKIEFNILILIISGLVFMAAKIPRKNIGMIAGYTTVAVSIAFLTFMFTFRVGNVIWAYGPLIIRDLGLQLAAIMGIRIFSFALFMLTVFSTTTQRELVQGLRTLHLPFILCYIISLSIRFIPTVSGDLTTIREAQSSRGAPLEEMSRFQKMKRLITVSIPLLMVAFRRVELMGNALEARAFDFSTAKNRTNYFDSPMSWQAKTVLFTAIAIFVFVVVMRFGFGWFQTFPGYL